MYSKNIMIINFDKIKCIILYIFLIFTTKFTFTNSGANNLHLYDGISTADVVGGDVFFEIIEPEELEYTYRVKPAKDFGAPFNASFVALGVPLVPTEPVDGCTKILNTDQIEGSVALIERGSCSFKSKTLIAQDSGALAVIITDGSVETEDFFIEMIDDDSDAEAHIPAGYLLGKNGHMIRKTLQKLNLSHAKINIPVNLTFTPVYKINQPPWLEW